MEVQPVSALLKPYILPKVNQTASTMPTNTAIKQACRQAQRFLGEIKHSGGGKLPHFAERVFRFSGNTCLSFIIERNLLEAYPADQSANIFSTLLKTVELIQSPCGLSTEIAVVSNGKFTSLM